MNELHKEIAKYLSGKMSNEEAKTFLKKFESQKGQEELSKDIENLWSEDSGGQLPEWDSSKLFHAIQQSKENQRYLITDSKPSHQKELFTNFPWKIASLILFIFTASGIFWLGRNQPEQSSQDVVEIVKSNPSGQKSTIYLPDGSNVVLNSSGKITYFSDFGHVNRSIQLVGEAYFEVKKDTTPFVVHTNNLATRASGTSFNEGIEVALITGKVCIQNTANTNQKLTLLPGEAAILTEKQTLKKDRFDIDTKSAWKDGIIYFDRTPFNEAKKVLERWYGVHFIIEGKVPENLYCTGSFKNDYLNNVLESSLSHHH